jgi:hypothetical protein
MAILFSKRSSLSFLAAFIRLNITPLAVAVFLPKEPPIDIGFPVTTPGTE